MRTKPLSFLALKRTRLVGEVGEVIVLFDLSGLIFVVQVGDEPVLCVLQDVGADELTSWVARSGRVQLRALLGDAVVDLAQISVLPLRGTGCAPLRSRTGRIVGLFWKKAVHRIGEDLAANAFRVETSGCPDPLGKIHDDDTPFRSLDDLFLKGILDSAVVCSLAMCPQLEVAERLASWPPGMSSSG